MKVPKTALGGKIPNLPNNVPVEKNIIPFTNNLVTYNAFKFFHPEILKKKLNRLNEA